MFKSHRSSGMTLIEFMIGCSLTFVILGILLAIYLSAQQIFQQQSKLLLIQNDINEVKNVFTQNIHQAGFIGCAKLTDDFPVQNNTSFLLQRSNRIAPYENQLSAPDSDGFQTWYAADRKIQLYKKMRQLNVLIIKSALTVKPDEVLVISDCHTADIFIIKKVEFEKFAIKITAKKSLSKLYDENAEIFRLAKNAFYIASVKKHPDSLFWHNERGENIELMHNVKKMKITYDLDAEDHARGIHINLQLPANFASLFYQNWYFYVALRQG